MPEAQVGLARNGTGRVRLSKDFMGYAHMVIQSTRGLKEGEERDSFPFLKIHFFCRVEADLGEHENDYKITIVVQVRNDNDDEAALDLRLWVDTGMSHII